MNFINYVLCLARGYLGLPIVGKLRGLRYVGVRSSPRHTRYAVIDGQFIGLALDQENQKELTAQRLETWLARLQQQL